jgi:hypothetical protein
MAKPIRMMVVAGVPYQLQHWVGLRGGGMADHWGFDQNELSYGTPGEARLAGLKSQLDGRQQDLIQAYQDLTEQLGRIIEVKGTIRGCLAALGRSDD